MDGYIIADASGQPISLKLYPVQERASEELAAWRTEFPGDYRAHRVLPAKIIVDRPTGGNVSVPVSIETDNGWTFEGPANFTAEWEEPDRFVGDPGGWTATFEDMRFGAEILTRTFLIDAMSLAEVEAIEERAVDYLNEHYHGEMVA